MMNGKKNTEYHFILIIIIAIIFTGIVMSISFSPTNLYEPLEKPPWNKTNLNFYVDTSSVSDAEEEIYVHNALVAFRWWESSEGTERLGYQVNFTQVHDTKQANIIINWIEKLYNNENTLGHAYINTSPTNVLGFQVEGERGDQSCDTCNPPFTLCNITIKLGLSDIEMQRVIKHEIGHSFGLVHSFNIKYSILGVLPSYRNNPDDIMSDLSVVTVTAIFCGIFVCLISIIYIIINEVSKSLNK